MLIGVSVSRFLSMGRSISEKTSFIQGSVTFPLSRAPLAIRIFVEGHRKK
jgi:hypothetical protein